MENSSTPEDLRAVLCALAQWLRDPAQEDLRRSFTVWIKRVLLPARMLGIDVPHVNDLEEVSAMLAERVTEWTRDWKQQGIEEDRRIGYEQGRHEGRHEGEAALLLRLAERRFGPLPFWARAKIQEADADTLLGWGENVLDAETLEELFR